MTALDLSDSIEVVQFENENMSTATNRIRNHNAANVRVSQQTTRMCVTLTNAIETGTFDLELYAEGSYDRRAWSRVGLASLNITIGAAPAVPQFQQTSVAVKVDYPYIRMRAKIAGGSALFSASFIFSNQ